MTEDARFFRFVEITSPAGCWIWGGAHQQRGGYGHIGRNGRSILAHRHSYELLIGPIADGMVCDHLCRTPECVNPYHLDIVTVAENSRRGLSTGARKTHCPSGHPYDDGNTYHNPARRGFRSCRTCGRAASAAYRARKGSA